MEERRVRRGVVCDRALVRSAAVPEIDAEVVGANFGVGAVWYCVNRCAEFTSFCKR